MTAAAQRQDLKEAGVIVLPSADIPIDVRMTNIRDWRKSLGERVGFETVTDFLFARAVFDVFYRQHRDIFLRAFGARAGQARILDIGCGECYGVEHWAHRCGEYHGVDMSPTQLEMAARYLAAQNNVSLYLGLVNEESFPDDFADMTISSEVIEHVDDPTAHVRECFRVTKPGGVLSLSTPCASMYFHPSLLFNYLRHNRPLWLKTINAHRYWQEMLPSHPALRPRVLRRMVEDEGFVVEKQFSRLLYFDAPPQRLKRLSRALERRGYRFHLPVYDAIIRFLEALLSAPVPVLRFAGTRQFIVARKPAA